MEPSVVQINTHRILLVEDDPIIQKVHRAYLLRMGYEVDVVISGEEALAVYSNDYSLVILDAHLPRLDGFSVAKYIRLYEASQRLQAMPLILLSAYPEEHLAQECAKVGINAFATKPISFDSLQTLVCKQLRQCHFNRAYLDKSKRSYQQ